MCRFCGFKKKRKVKFFSFHSLEHFTAKTRSVKRLKFLVSCSISRASIRKLRPEIWLKESDKRSRVPWKQTNASKKADSFFVYYIFQALFNQALARSVLRVLVISLLIIGFVAGARRRARYNLYQRLLSKGDNQVSITYNYHLLNEAEYPLNN